MDVKLDIEKGLAQDMLAVYLIAVVLSGIAIFTVNNLSIAYIDVIGGLSNLIWAIVFLLVSVIALIGYIYKNSRIIQICFIVVLIPLIWIILDVVQYYLLGTEVI